jgi:alpha-tubulin suppressor-like RCC1 family protein
MRMLILLAVLPGCIVVPANRQARHGARVHGQVTVGSQPGEPQQQPPAYGTEPQPQEPPTYGAAPAPPPPAYGTPPQQQPTYGTTSSGLKTKAVATGENHMCVLVQGEVHCWGSNYKGTMGVAGEAGVVRGIGKGSHDVIQVVAGDYHTCAITASREMWCWGSNFSAQLGQGELSETHNTPKQVRERDIKEIFAGSKSTCLQKDDGTVLCWGQDTVGAITPGVTANGPPVLKPTRVRALDGADDLAIGDYTICALRAGKVSCTGWLASMNGQVAALPAVTSLTAGWGHACVLAGGKVMCWGRNFMGAMGKGDPCATQPNKDARSACLLKDADVVYPPGEVPGITGQVTKVSDTCALTAAGQVYCWGGRGQNVVDKGQQDPYRPAHALAIPPVSGFYTGDTFFCFVRSGQLSCVGQPWSPKVSAAI